MLKQLLDKERKGGIDLHTKLRESEHKRNEHLRKNQELLKRILELENEIRVLKQRFKEIMVKKASAILREQFQ